MQTDLVRQLAVRADRLTQTLDATPLVGEVIAGKATADTYRSFLRVSYQYVRWSGHLLALTAAGLRRRARYPRLAELVSSKAAEEAPHDRWALADLAACGGNVDEATCAPLPRAVVAYVAWAEALAESGSPGYLGAAYLLEGISWRRASAAARRLREAKEIPHVEEAVTFLEAHGEADASHIAALDDALAVLDGGPDVAEVLTSADTLSVLYPRFFAAETR